MSEMTAYTDFFEASIPALDWDMPVEVMRDFDTALLLGRLAAVSQREVAIRRISSKLSFPIMEVGSAVMLRCYDTRSAPVLLRGQVLHSSGMECTMGELELIPCKTQRKCVRYPLCPPVLISVLDNAEMGGVQPCQLVNISGSGACIVTRGGFAVGQKICLRVRAPETDRQMSCSCEVVRAAPRRDGCFEYGLLFKGLDEEQTRCLLEILRSWPHMCPDRSEDHEKETVSS